MAYDQEKKVAMEGAIAAAKLCDRVRGDIPQAIEKSDKSPVTVADYGAQALICKALAEVFPDDPIVGEEDATELRKPAMGATLTKVTSYVKEIIPDATEEKVTTWIDQGNGKVGSRYWTLDPIDGTKGFLRQDQYAVALALVEDGEVKLGVLACPALNLSETTGILFVAVRGEGTIMMPIAGGEAKRIKVVSKDDRDRFRFVESVESGHGDQSRQNAIAQAVGITTESVRVDSQAKYGIVAAGEAALYLRLPSPKSPDYRENIWDHAAGAIVVEEAGGRVTDMYGKPLDFAGGAKMMDNQGVVVSNGAIHDQVLAALQQ
ncbi:MAG: 3'(2'),5'-bisphosphate nucleotidase [Gomphosphaeria aponina SAG 52.96 = DSM 107014]|uniref:3'(2'),5'-bisphosphate nucleotidase n=1 Tax=Gomphosphaeria aponina SAG 52.96 = DSM 107014 TaxID=1521640 RepID=A0A941GQF9_9CHRO|nr:3'(2'),5'-bisphosphate nucleotidase [Gomphosphaeria aponina SAG 52.96 = DSM 107014]